MAQYAQLADCTDPSIRVSAEHLDGAYVQVDADLWAKGIDPAEVLDEAGQVRQAAAGLLRQLAVAYASEQAAREQARGEGTLLTEKANGYAAQAKTINSKVSRAALGLLAPGEEQRPGVGLASIEIGRG
jgi:hypothetical protein